jgi:hypothetical protein
MKALATLLLLALALSAQAALPPAPQSIIAGYDVFRGGLRIATMSESFESKDGEYRLVSETRAVGVFALVQKQPLRFTSQGQLAENGLQPRHFEGKRGEADPRQVRGDFDWEAGSLTISHDGKTDTFPLGPGTQDRLSVLYQFMFLGPERLQRLEFAMTNGRKLDRYRYTVTPNVEIDTPLGRLTTLHLVKQHRPDESGTEVWLSPQHRYLPVKVMVQEEDGARYEQFITRLEIREPQP